MNINKENYELFLMDYLDGNLDDSLSEELRGFLISHPEIEEELEMLEDIRLSPESENYQDKEKLKAERISLKMEGISEEDLLCIDYIEGQLNASQKASFEQRLEKDPDMGALFDTYKQTIIPLDSAVSYPRKNQLKHRKLSLFYFSAAAVLLIMIGVLGFLNREGDALKNQGTNPRLSEIFDPIEKPDVMQWTQRLDEAELIAHSYRIVDKDESIFIPLDQELIPQLSKASSKSPYYEISGESSPEIVFAYHAIRKVVSDDSDYLNFSEFLARKIKKDYLDEKDEKGLYRLSFWDIADLGIEGINKVLGSQMSLDKRYNEFGKVDRLDFNSRLLAFSTSTKRLPLLK